MQSLSSCVDQLLFYDDKRRLIILTRSLLLVQLQVDDDGRVIPVQKVKLSVAGGAGDRGIRQVIWAGSGLIAAASGEAVVTPPLTCICDSHFVHYLNLSSSPLFCIEWKNLQLCTYV